MISSYKTLIISVFCTITFLSSCGQGEDPEQKEAEIRAKVVSYIIAFNARDVDAIADHWSDEAVYRNQITGDLVSGKEGIKKEFQVIFDRLDDAKVELKIETIRFPFENKAVEEGIARILRPGKPPIESDYKIIHVRKDGKWLILNVSELDIGALGTEKPDKENNGK